MSCKPVDSTRSVNPTVVVRPSFVAETSTDTDSPFAPPAGAVQLGEVPVEPVTVTDELSLASFTVVDKVAPSGFEIVNDRLAPPVTVYPPPSTRPDTVSPGGVLPPGAAPPDAPVVGSKHGVER
jgi:hypothetical protein